MDRKRCRCGWRASGRGSERQTENSLVSLTIHSASAAYTYLPDYCEHCAVFSFIYYLSACSASLGTVITQCLNKIMRAHTHRHYGLVQMCLITVPPWRVLHISVPQNVKFGWSSVVKWCNLNLMAIVASRCSLRDHTSSLPIGVSEERKVAYVLTIGMQQLVLFYSAKYPKPIIVTFCFSWSTTPSVFICQRNVFRFFLSEIRNVNKTAFPIGHAVWIAEIPMWHRARHTLRYETRTNNIYLYFELVELNSKIRS